MMQRRDTARIPPLGRGGYTKALNSTKLKIQNLSKFKICDSAGLGSNPGQPPNRGMEIILPHLMHRFPALVFS
jgi:hypothetical protein